VTDVSASVTGGEALPADLVALVLTQGGSMVVGGREVDGAVESHEAPVLMVMVLVRDPGIEHQIAHEDIEGGAERRAL
jgi:hypothetical protein